MSEKLELLSTKIEDIYINLEKTLNEVLSLENTLKELDSKSNTVIDKYKSAMDSTKIKKLHKDNNSALDKVIEDINKIESTLSSLDASRNMTVEKIETTYRKLQDAEKKYGKPRKNIESIEHLLKKIIIQIEKDRRSSDEKIIKASKYFEANAVVEKYDELIRLERENNKLLKEIKNSVKGPTKQKMKHFQSDKPQFDINSTK